MSGPVTRLRVRFVIILCIGVIPTALSDFITRTLSKEHSLADNLSRFGLILLQPLSVTFHDSIPHWMILTVFYLQFPLYATLLLSVIRTDRFSSVGRALIWIHFFAVVAAGSRTLYYLSSI